MRALLLLLAWAACGGGSALLLSAFEARAIYTIANEPFTLTSPNVSEFAAAFLGITPESSATEILSPSFDPMTGAAFITSKNNMGLYILRDYGTVDIGQGFVGKTFVKANGGAGEVHFTLGIQSWRLAGMIAYPAFPGVYIAGSSNFEAGQGVGYQHFPTVWVLRGPVGCLPPVITNCNELQPVGGLFDASGVQRDFLRNKHAAGSGQNTHLRFSEFFEDPTANPRIPVLTIVSGTNYKLSLIKVSVTGTGTTISSIGVTTFTSAPEPLWAHNSRVLSLYTIGEEVAPAVTVMQAPGSSTYWVAIGYVGGRLELCKLTMASGAPLEEANLELQYTSWAAQNPVAGAGPNVIRPAFSDHDSDRIPDAMLVHRYTTAEGGNSFVWFNFGWSTGCSPSACLGNGEYRVGCKCGACPPGTRRLISGQSPSPTTGFPNCVACGDTGTGLMDPSKTCTVSGSVSAASLQSGFCSYFDTGISYAADIAIGMRLDPGDVDAGLVFGSSAIATAAASGTLRGYRNAHARCGTLSASLEGTGYSTNATRPTKVRFDVDVENAEELPVVVRLDIPPAVSIVKRDTPGAATWYNGATFQVDPAGSVGLEVTIDTALLPAGEFVNSDVKFVYRQFWYQKPAGVPETETTVTVPVTLQFVETSTIVLPAEVVWVLQVDEVANRSLTVFNLHSQNTTFDAQLQYVGPTPAPWMSITDGGGGSTLSPITTCQSCLAVPSSEEFYSSGVDLSVFATSVPAGFYSAQVVVQTTNRASPNVVVPVSLTVTPGAFSTTFFDFAFEIAGVSDESFNSVHPTSLQVGQAVAIHVIPRDRHGDPTTVMGSVDPSAASFNLTVTRNDCPVENIANPEYCQATRSLAWSPLVHEWETESDVRLELAGNYTFHVTSSLGSLSNDGVVIPVAALPCETYDANSRPTPFGERCTCLAGFRESSVVELVQGRVVACSICSAGQYDPGDRTCVPCPAGSISASNGATSCVACATFNKVADGTQTSCVSCPAGKAVDDPNTRTYSTTTCEFCSIGYVARESPTNGTECVRCGTYREEPTADQTDCVSCLTDWIVRATDASWACEPCDADRYAVVSDSTVTPKVWTCACRSAFYLSENGTCVDCPTGAFCASRTYRNLLPLSGYFQAGPLTFIACRDAAACPGIDPRVTNLGDSQVAAAVALYEFGTSQAQAAGSCSFCTAGTSGPLCLGCDVGWTKVGQTCAGCLSRAAVLAMLILGALCAILATMYIVWRAIAADRDSEEVQIIKIATSHLQTISIASGMVGWVAPLGVSLLYVCALADVAFLRPRKPARAYSP